MNPLKWYRRWKRRRVADEYLRTVDMNRRNTDPLGRIKAQALYRRWLELWEADK